MRFASCRPEHSSILTSLVAALFCTACHWVDPHCVFRSAAMKEDGPLDPRQPRFLRLILRLPSTRVLLQLYGNGGWKYVEFASRATSCRNMGQEEYETIAGSWSGPALEASGPLCGPGYAYLPSGYEIRNREDICAGAWNGVVQRAWQRVPRGRRGSSARDPLPAMEMTFYPEGTSVLDGGPVRFFWDLESRLPEALDQAATGMFGLLCAENEKLSLLFRRHPELAASAGCLEEA